MIFVIIHQLSYAKVPGTFISRKFCLEKVPSTYTVLNHNDFLKLETTKEREN